jgi:CHAT domain-containing protein
MSDLHADLPRYVDGELEAEAAARFSDHLVACMQCQRELSELVSLDVAAARAVGSSAWQRVWEALFGRWRVVVSASAGMAALATAASLVMAVELRELRLLESPTRRGEIRLPDRPHQEPDTVRGTTQEAPPESPEPPLLALGWLKWRGDSLGLAEAYLVRGDTQAAKRWLDQAGTGAEALAARAAFDLLAGKSEDAVRDADAALRVPGPPSSTAMWNRGLALETLELPLAAAQAFDAVAALGEPGWADEAKKKVKDLREKAERRQKAYADGQERCDAAMRGERSFPVDLAVTLPRLARLCFYDAMRSAGTAEALAALEPAAKALGTEAALKAARAGWRPDRIALAQGYLEALAAKKARAYRREGGQDWLALAAAAQAGRQPDIELGALYFVPFGKLDLERYQALARQTGDPWFAVLAEERAAQVDVQRGQPLRALERLSSLQARCATSTRVEDRCLTVERELAFEEAMLHRTAEAKAAALHALRRARIVGELTIERGLLEELSQMSRLRGELAMAQAYLEEVLARSPGSCDVAEQVRSELAVAHQRRLELDEARRQVDALAGCDGPPSLRRMFALADLQRSRPKPGDEVLLARGAEARRAEGASPGDLALVDHILGRAALETDRARGERLLRKAIAEADALSGGTDRTPDKARLYSYTSLILDAGRRGDFGAALALFSESRRWAAPPACSVWLTLDDERLLVLAVDAVGKVLGRYDGARARPPEEGEALVPPELVEAVRGCESVQVIARPPLEGRPGLLPSDLAWSQVVRRGTAPAAGQGPRVVVASVAQPASLGLSALSAPPPLPGEVRLEGPAATPSRVMQAARDASVLELHVHGVRNPEAADASYLVLSPEPSGRSALTARDVRSEVLSGHPLVLLAACDSGATVQGLEQGDGLPVAFVEAGARAVLAVNAKVEDAEAEQFFRPLLARIQAGDKPAAALRAARADWQRAHGPGWVDQVVLFE